VSPDDTTLKRCSKCCEWKSRDLFSSDRSKKDGLSSLCKACRSESDRKFHSEHREERNERCRRYHAEHREDRLESFRQQYAEHREERQRYARRYTAEHGIARLESNRRYNAANIDVRRAQHHRRRARKFGNGGTYSASDLISIRAAQTDKQGRLICWACGKPITGTPHLDHWIPLAQGGLNEASNLHYMHARCNMTKHTKHPTEIGRLI
jgi:hypothetical protein